MTERTEQRQDIPGTLTQIIELGREAAAPFVVILDIDNTLTLTTEARILALNLYARLVWGVNPNSLPTLEEVIKMGGIENTYPRVFGDQSKATIDRLREKPQTYKRAGAADPNVAGFLSAALGREGTVIGYVSARFFNNRILADTQRQLFEQMGLPVAPMILRPEEVSIESAEREWKIGLIDQIASALPQKQVIIIDDHTDFATGIARRNAGRTAGTRPIIDIVYEGTTTAPKVASGKFQAAPANGIYTASWQSLGQVMETVREMYTPNLA